MSHDRDVKAFNQRAPGYESGWLGQLHHDIADRAVNLALATAPDARRVLDVGSGTGYVLRQYDSLYRCLYYAAMRPSEAIALREADCHLPACG